MIHPASPLAVLALLSLASASCKPMSTEAVAVDLRVTVEDQATPRDTIEADEAQAEAGPTPVGSEPTPIALKHLIGEVDPASDPLFARIPPAYLGGSRVWAHKDAVAALTAMADAAAADGVTLKAVSAFRSFADQKRIWENKWSGATRVDGGRLPDTHPDPAARARKILEQSSMPGTSRHHWGTDFDLNDLTNAYFSSGEGKRAYDWLQTNAPRFGFCQTYTAKGPDRPNGYEEEKWHWSYMPVAGAYLAAYPRVVGYDHISGFEGAETARSIDVIASYVQGVDPACAS
jgi:LAS superfamily LD-carboxypeptidase LdcB